jgi:hypothetical protein
LSWGRPEVLFLGLAFFYQFLFTATVDPVLSISRDWDMLSGVALSATLLGAALARQAFAQLGDARHRRILAGLALAPAILSSSIFFVNAHEGTISKRISSMGEWTFASYWVGSSYIINVGEKMVPDPEEEIRARRETLARLALIKSERDPEYGFLQSKLAMRHFTLGRFGEADSLYRAALATDPEDFAVRKLLAMNSLMLWKFDEAEELLARYNAAMNEPVVSDFAGLRVAQFTNNIAFLLRNGRDSTAIRKMLDDMFRLNGGEINRPG